MGFLEVVGLETAHEGERFLNVTREDGRGLRQQKAVNDSGDLLPLLGGESSEPRGLGRVDLAGKLHPGVCSVTCPWHRQGAACFAFSL